ncbi:MAG TPA: FtsX-like permease family protein [Kofleriaceae bacterium]
MVDIPSVLATLRRYRIASALIAIEVVLACAIFSNVIFLVSERVHRITLPSGMSEDQLVQLEVAANINSDPDSAQAATLGDVAALSSLPGVASATVTNQVPFSGGEWNTGIMLHPDQKQPTVMASLYMGDARFLDTFGLRLVEGRVFNPDEVQWMSGDAKAQNAILSEATARQLFPGKSGLGETIYLGDTQPVRVVGIVERLIRPNFGFAESSKLEYSVIVPVRVPYASGADYVIRTSASERDRVLTEARARLLANNPGIAIVSQGTMEAQRDKFFQQERSVAWLLGAVCLALLVVTALGIFGLTSFWTQQRTHQIGVRRALGATRRQVLAQFMAETGLLVAIGVVLGVPLAVAINSYLVDAYGILRLNSRFLLVGSLALLTLGQLSVWVPARRAASVSPAEATRTR